jgi:hypothetical protein
MNSIKWILLVAILMLTVGCCMTDADRDLYQKITVSCKIVAVNPDGSRDNITVEFPTGERCSVHVPRGMYQIGDTYSKRMWKWRAIELGIGGDS